MVYSNTGNSLDYRRFLIKFIKLSRMDWSFIFAGFYFMVSLFYALPRYELILGFISMYLIAMGHLSLNGLYDKETDSYNPRGLSLQNPLTEKDNFLTEKHVYIWVSILWSLALLLNIFFLPHNNIDKIIIALLFFGICIVFSIMYSAPPFRLKGRPIIDLFSTFGIFGIGFPLYSAFITTSITLNPFSFSSYIPISILIVGILFNMTLLIGIHIPTVLGDLEFDKKAGDVTTAVYLGWDLGSIVTVFASFARTISLALTVSWLIVNNIISLNWFVAIPYLLAIPDVYFTIKLLFNRDRQSTINLWKSIILTSILGGFSIGYLYFTKNPALLEQYFMPLLNLMF